MKIFLTIFVSFAALLTHAQEGEVMKGNRYYKEGNYDKAEQAYQKALSKKENLIARYNLGNTLYKKESIDDAVKSFDGVINATDLSAAFAARRLLAEAFPSDAIQHQDQASLIT